MSENKHQTHKLSIISIWIGITIPIIAAIIPYAYEFIEPDYNLAYSINELVLVDGKSAINITVNNQGNKIESSVEISIKKSSIFKLISKLSKENPVFIVDTDAPIKKEENDNAFSINLGDLRPGEKVELSVLVETLIFRRHNNAVDEVSVKSKEHIGEEQIPSDFEKFAYPFGFWMFIIFMVLTLIVGIYQEYIMDPKVREKKLWEELEKIQKKIS